MAQDAEDKKKNFGAWITEKIRERLFGTMVSLCVFLVGFYVKSFASTKDLRELEVKQDAAIQEVVNQQDKDRQAVTAELDKLKQGLCIIDKRTCKLFK